MCLCCGFLMCAMLCELRTLHTLLFQRQANPLRAPAIDLTPHPLSQQTSPTLGCLAPVLKSCSCLAVVDWLPASVFSRLSACFSSLTSLQLNSLPFFFHWSFQSRYSGGQQWEGKQIECFFCCFFSSSWKIISRPRGPCPLNHAFLFDASLWSQYWAKMWHVIHFFLLLNS